MASRRIRMAQPYGGGGSGMSFPLVKGTEVIWTCIDGDIDRPIITGTVPNPLNPSVTNTENATSNVIKTSSGITMGFQDGSGSASQAATGSGDSLAAQQQSQSMIPSMKSVLANSKNLTETPVFTTASMLPGTKRSRSLTQQQQQVDVSSGMGATLAGEVDAGSNLWDGGDGKRWMVLVPDYDETGERDTNNTDSFFRLGMASKLETDAGGGWETNGWLDYTDGDHSSITKGDRTDFIGGTHTVLNEKSTYEYSLASSTRYKMAATNWHSIGVKTSSALAASVTSDAGITVGFSAAANFSFSTAANYSYALGPTFTSASEVSMEAKNTVCISVDPDDDVDEEILEEFIPASAISIARYSARMTALIAIGGDATGGGAAWEALSIAHSVAMAAAGVAAAAMAVSVNRDKTTTDEPAASLEMDTTSVKIQANGGKSLEEGHIILEARTEFGDTDPAKIKVDKDGVKGSIKIDASCTDNSGDIELKVGASSIIIKDTSIVFKSEKFFFYTDEGETKGMELLADEFNTSCDIGAEGKIKSMKDITADGDMECTKLKYTNLDGDCKV
jgi:hypothetical protein